MNSPSDRFSWQRFKLGNKGQEIDSLVCVYRTPGPTPGHRRSALARCTAWARVNIPCPTAWNLAKLCVPLQGRRGCGLTRCDIRANVPSLPRFHLRTQQPADASLRAFGSRQKSRWLPWRGCRLSPSLSLARKSRNARMSNKLGSTSSKAYS